MWRKPRHGKGKAIPLSLPSRKKHPKDAWIRWTFARSCEITVPMLLCVGEETPISPSEQQQCMVEQIPTCRPAVYPNVGHGINVLQPRCKVEHVIRAKAHLCLAG